MFFFHNLLQNWLKRPCSGVDNSHVEIDDGYKIIQLNVNLNSQPQSQKDQVRMRTGMIILQHAFRLAEALSTLQNIKFFLSFF